MNRSYRINRILLLIFVISFFTNAQGQEDTVGFSQTAIPNGWFQLGVGVKKGYVFLGGNLFFRIADRVAIGIRSGNSAEIRDPFINPWETFWDITPAIAYAPVVGLGGMVSGFAGIGIVGGVRRGEFLRREGLVLDQYEEIRFRRFCLAFELQATVFIPGTRVLGLTGSVFTNVNRERPFVGYQIGVQFRQPR